MSSWELVCQTLPSTAAHRSLTVSARLSNPFTSYLPPSLLLYFGRTGINFSFRQNGMSVIHWTIQSAVTMSFIKWRTFRSIPRKGWERWRSWHCRLICKTLTDILSFNFYPSILIARCNQSHSVYNLPKSEFEKWKNQRFFPFWNFQLLISQFLSTTFDRCVTWTKCLRIEDNCLDNCRSRTDLMSVTTLLQVDTWWVRCRRYDVTVFIRVYPTLWHGEGKWWNNWIDVHWRQEWINCSVYLMNASSMLDTFVASWNETDFILFWLLDSRQSNTWISNLKSENKLNDRLLWPNSELLMFYYRSRLELNTT